MPDIAVIEAMMQDYMIGLHEGDVAAIDKQFLPECDLCCTNEDGSYIHMALQQYKDLVEGRRSPKELGYPVYGHVVHIDQSGPNTAFVKIDCAVQPKYFIDYLSLIKTNGEWKIASKVYYAKKYEE
ncbi:nuclear transport factor 2 family protein [Tropicibacter sp. Alg240-R139]|uniref:nuclear transport factor 2 family protein n=1 Tax=Tropicibacter sp. Alg240-R139 TaxID=2305991 RepID=UPI0013E04349|nr:nuclear transport factor 2 family protein [Tropicibacter sp. Alg240-R139]